MQLKALISQNLPKTRAFPARRMSRFAASLTILGKVKPGTLFVALRGEKSDGHDFIEQAIRPGAAAMLGRARGAGFANCHSWSCRTRAPHWPKWPRHFISHPVAAVEDDRRHRDERQDDHTFLLKHICEKEMTAMRAARHGALRGRRPHPARRAHHAGVAGRAGTALRECALRAARPRSWKSPRTRSCRSGCGRIEWDCAVFTNLTQDHLDYHGTMEKYFEAKSLLFTAACGAAEEKGNGRHQPGRPLRREARGDRRKAGVPVLTYGLGVRADFRASNMKIDFGGTSYQLDAKGKSFLVRLPLIGRFNVYNSLAAIAAASTHGH